MTRRTAKAAPSPKSTQAEAGREYRTEWWARVTAEGQSRYAEVRIDVAANTVVVDYDLLTGLLGRAGLSQAPAGPDGDDYDPVQMPGPGGNYVATPRMTKVEAVEPSDQAGETSSPPADAAATVVTPGGDADAIDSAGAETVTGEPNPDPS